jgi:hypothetical protein
MLERVKRLQVEDDRDIGQFNLLYHRGCVTDAVDAGITDTMVTSGLNRAAGALAGGGDN